MRECRYLAIHWVYAASSRAIAIDADGGGNASAKKGGRCGRVGRGGGNLRDSVGPGRRIPPLLFGERPANCMTPFCIFLNLVDCIVLLSNCKYSTTEREARRWDFAA